MAYLRLIIPPFYPSLGLQNFHSCDHQGFSVIMVRRVIT